MNIGEIVNHQYDIRSVVSSKILPINNLFGVEVELENVPGVVGSNLKYWYVKEDGSLRNSGAEFVFKSPLGGSDVILAVMELESFIKENNLKPDLSDRTSVHVHVDVRHFSAKQLQRLVILYTIFERVLFNFAGPDRFNNIFCLPIENAQGMVYHLNKICHLRNFNDFRRATRDLEKYSAFNIRSLEQYGSVEFRIHKGEWRSRKLIRWIKVLAQLTKAAIEDVEIENIHSSISGDGPINYLSRVFGKSSHLLIYDTVDIDIMEGVRLSQDVLNINKMIESPLMAKEREDDLLSQYLKENNITKSVGITAGDLMNAYNINADVAHRVIESGIQQMHIDRIQQWRESQAEQPDNPDPRQGIRNDRVHIPPVFRGDQIFHEEVQFDYRPANLGDEE